MSFPPSSDGLPSPAARRSSSPLLSTSRSAGLPSACSTTLSSSPADRSSLRAPSRSLNSHLCRPSTRAHGPTISWEPGAAGVTQVLHVGDPWAPTRSCELGGQQKHIDYSIPPPLPPDLAFALAPATSHDSKHDSFSPAASHKGVVQPAHSSNDPICAHFLYDAVVLCWGALAMEEAQSYGAFAPVCSVLLKPVVPAFRLRCQLIELLPAELYPCVGEIVGE